jgi:hypothetical protein
MIDAFWLQGMMAGHKNANDSIKAFSETDFTEDLRRFDTPTLLVHRQATTRSCRSKHRRVAVSACVPLPY